MSVHTETPWEIGTYSDAMTRLGHCVKHGDDTVCDVYAGKNDAAFIVRACNNFDELVAALELANTILQGAVHPACRKPGDGLSKIEAALAKVTE